MRFSTASVALFAGAALALPGYEQTVYSTREVTVTSCGPEVTDCPGRHHSTPSVVVPTATGVPQKPLPTQYSTHYITVTDCGPEVTNCPAHSTRVKTSVATIIPTPSGSSPVTPIENPQNPQNPQSPQSPPNPQNPQNPQNPPYPTAGNPSTSIVTFTTCVPTVSTSVVTLWPTAGPTGGSSGQPTYLPTGGVPGSPSGSVVPPPPKATSPPIYTGAASTVGHSFAAVGLAGIVAAIFA
ncbi:hypothetical protein PRK78_000712 [Emydomyces testavorans]|uniref:GPI anchored serine-rich protein n=1 Tax=Emydomyces testavorans TaxID=2070801 RepID=A0AAF0DBK7_9EURO|nr:hypothetical protein PRK78_000712 [Emydomyces testavorans]